MRVEKHLIPPDAMREIMVNALIHRDYAIAGGAISLAIFDDRVEVWSAGAFPRGITPEILTRKHLSMQRNPLIADMFHRVGLIEKWGRGTNRVVDMCREAGITPPEFEEVGESALVTFRVQVGNTAPADRRAESRAESLELKILKLLLPGPRSVAEITSGLGQTTPSGAMKRIVREMLRKGFLERTIPSKPNSRLQKYRLTAEELKSLSSGR